MRIRRHKIHGYLGFEKIDVEKALQKSMENVLQYESVKMVNEMVEIVDKDHQNNLFLITTNSKSKEVNHIKSYIPRKKIFKSRYLIIATGVDHLKPKVKNFEKFIGNGIWHCPHCDGFESTNKKLIIIASNNRESKAIDYAKVFLGWTKDITLFLQRSNDIKQNMQNNKLFGLTDKQRNEANLLGIKVIEDDHIVKIIENSKMNSIEGVMTKLNQFYEADIIFYYIGTVINNEFATGLGCQMDEGYIKVNEKQQTSVPNVYAAGDIDTDRHYAIFAAASGALAALSIYEELLKDSLSIIKSNNT